MAAADVPTAATLSALTEQVDELLRLVLQLLDAELSETDEEGRLLTFGKVAIAVVASVMPAWSG